MYLEGFHFDQLLEPVNDEKVTVFVVMADIASAEPSVSTDHLVGGFLVFVVALHDLRASDEEFSVLVRTQGPLASFQVHHLGLSSRKESAARTQFLVAQWTHHNSGRHFSQSVCYKISQICQHISN